MILGAQELSTPAVVGVRADAARDTESLLLSFPNVIQIYKMFSVVMVSRNYRREIINKNFKSPKTFEKNVITINEIPSYRKIHSTIGTAFY